MNNNTPKNSHWLNDNLPVNNYWQVKNNKVCLFGKPVKKPAVMINTKQLNVIMFGEFEKLHQTVMSPIVIYGPCEADRLRDIAILILDGISPYEVVYVLKQMYDAIEPGTNLSQLFIKDIVEKFMSRCHDANNTYRLSNTEELRNYLNACESRNPEMRINNMLSERLYTDKDEIVVNPDSTAQLREAMFFKSQHIKAKANGSLFEAVAHKLEKLEAIEAVLSEIDFTELNNATKDLYMLKCIDNILSK